MIKQALRFMSHCSVWICLFVKVIMLLHQIHENPDRGTDTWKNDNFAIIQNSVVLRHRVGDLLCAMERPSEIDIDGENVELVRPHIGLAGVPIRARIFNEMARIMPDIYDAIQKIDDKIDFCPPVDAMMWNFTNTLARHINPNAVPIYMDKINYIQNKIDTPRIKYGRLARPARNVEEHYQRVLTKYDDALQSALTARAPRG